MCSKLNLFYDISYAQILLKLFRLVAFQVIRTVYFWPEEKSYYAEYAV